MSSSNPTKVAIACQGGGSHAAFAAGALGRLLRETDGRLSDHEVVALSGTSGGAICAATGWYGLLDGGSERAADLLEAVWREIAVDSVPGQVANAVSVWTAAVAAYGGPMVRVSPYYHPFDSLGREQFVRTLRRHVEFDRFDRIAEGADADLIVGATDVNDGEFETFRNERVTAEAVLASSAVPTLFEAVRIGENYYWDGLFSQNPPIREFLTAPDRVEEKPDEIWVVQVNPQSREEVPRTSEEIDDRRTELSANLSLNQEIEFVEQVNEWVAGGELEGEYKRVDVERIELREELSTPSKRNRSEAFIERMLRRGDDRATAFVEDRTGQ